MNLEDQGGGEENRGGDHDHHDERAAEEEAEEDLLLRLHSLQEVLAPARERLALARMQLALAEVEAWEIAGELGGGVEEMEEEVGMLEERLLEVRGRWEGRG